MVKRQLNETEKRIANKNLLLLAKELNYKENAELKKKQVTIEAAPLEYERQLEDLKSEEKKLIKEVEELTSTVKTLTKQIREGVDIIPPVDEKNKKEVK